MLEEKIKLKKAMNNNKSIDVVRDLFWEYVSSYKKSRRQSGNNFKEYRKIYCEYLMYMENKK